MDLLIFFSKALKLCIVIAWYIGSSFYADGHIMCMLLQSVVSMGIGYHML